MGPWAVGYFLDRDLGLLFPWGLWIDGHVLPADVTHLYGLFFMFPYIYVMILALALTRPSKRKTILSMVKGHWVWIMLLIFQFLHCVEFYLCYGALATLFGTCGLGRLVFVYYLWNSE